jgi:hypothetical protein
MRTWNARNVETVRARHRAYKKKDGGRRYKNAQLKTVFGITIEQYEHILTAQNSVCACCGQNEISFHQSGVRRRLAVDHDHVTGTVRGLLCSLCNRALGMLREDPRLIESLLKYVIKFKEEN